MSEPCGNEECDRCYPQPRFIVRTETVRRMRHERTIKANSADEAIAIYNEGTAWPSSYDEHTLATIEQGQPTAARWDEADPERAASWAKLIGSRCYNDKKSADA